MRTIDAVRRPGVGIRPEQTVREARPPRRR